MYMYIIQVLGFFRPRYHVRFIHVCMISKYSQGFFTVIFKIGYLGFGYFLIAHILATASSHIFWTELGIHTSEVQTS